MASLNMQGPYPLTKDKIDEIITKTSAGNYALGYVNEDKTFIVQYVGRADIDVSDRKSVVYVGRADADVASRLKQHVGEKYKRFKYSYATSPKAAFEKECHNYHDFGESKSLDNKIHPDRPANSNWKCPRCNIFD
mgnify:CR=1 FL=1